MDYMCQVSSSELGLIDPCLDPCVLDPCVDFVECALERGIDGAAARPGRRRPVETGLTRARHEPAIGATKSTRLEAPPSLWRADATSIVGKDFLPVALEEAVVGQGHGGICELRDDGIVPLICPTCQNVFAGIAQSIHASDHRATLHGVVFDILVGSQSRVGPCGCLSR